MIIMQILAYPLPNGRWHSYKAALILNGVYNNVLRGAFPGSLKLAEDKPLLVREHFYLREISQWPWAFKSILLGTLTPMSP